MSVWQRGMGICFTIKKPVFGMAVIRLTILVVSRGDRESSQLRDRLEEGSTVLSSIA